MTVIAQPRNMGGGARRALGASLVLALLLSVLSGAVGLSLARLVGSDFSMGSFATDVLAPPTGLAATGGASITLDWTATPKTWASGYTIWRATSVAGPYAQIDTVTPRTVESYVDTPSPGTYFYQLRAYYQDWLSVAAGPVSATVGSPFTSTGFKDCVATSDAADTIAAGDNDGYQTNAIQACSLDGTFAADSSSGTGGTQSCGVGVVPDVRKDRHRWWGYDFGLPGTVTSIDGIEVQALLRLTSNGGTTSLCTQLSGDGGLTWTTIASQDVSGGNDWTTYTFGGTSDTWGRTWTVGELGSANFRVRLIDASSQVTKVFRLDALQVQVTYTP